MQPLVAVLLTILGFQNSSTDVTEVRPSAAVTGVAILDSAPVAPGELHVLAWEMKVEGEKRWRFRAPFSGAILTYRDTDGNSIGEYRHHSSVWQTVDWRPAWIAFTPPERAATVSASLAIVTDEELPGRYLARQARVAASDKWFAPTQDLGSLRILIVDEHGAPTLARCWVWDAAGHPVAPMFSYTYELGGACYHVPDARLNVLTISPGRYRIEVQKGFEYARLQTEVTVEAGRTAEVRLALERQRNMAKEGWWSGDHHTHLYRHGGSLYPMMQLADVYAIARAEGLGFLPFMGLDTGQHGSDDYASEQFIGRVTEELTRDFWGHICPVGIRGLPTLAELGPGWAMGTGELWPMNFDYTAYMDKHDAAIAYAHPYGPIRAGNEFASLEDPESGLQARGYPIDLALGQSPALDMLTKEDAKGEFDLKLRDYMRLLSLGFRSGVSGSTDFHLDQGRQPIGGLRTYVHAGTLAWPHVTAAYRRGATFATNGPLITIESQGKFPGDVVELAAPGPITVNIHAQCEGRGRVSLWQQGNECWSVEFTGSTKSDVPVSFEHSGWVLAIVKGESLPHVMNAPEGKPLVDGQYAITSPVYVDVKGHPAPVDRDAATYFVDWIDAVERGFAKLLESSKPEGIHLPERERNAVQSRLNTARDVFASKARSAGDTR